MAKRRSIVEFEQWVGAQVEAAQAEILALRGEGQALARREEAAEVKLEALLAVQKQLQAVPDEDGE